MEAPSMSALINPKKKTPLCFLLISLLLASSSAMSWSDGIAIAEEDYDGLRAFKRSLSDPLGFLRSWNDSGPGACSGSWLGIKCAKGKVIAIQLPWRGLGGHISEKIGQLSSLRKLSLHDNSIGGQIPPSISFLSNLRGLILFRNRFSGEIPPSIGNCLKLQTLDLSDNSLSGKISNLVFNSSKLMRLNLSNNNFSGTIPAGIVKSPALAFLSLKRNALSGPIPSSLGKLSLLIEITLSENQLNGTIPEEIASLLLLETLDISQNFIEGTFPASLCNLSSLRSLNLAGNFIKGRLPDSISKFANLSILSLKMNNLTGEIPATIGSMSNLSQLDLSDNNFTGQIPAIISHLPKLSNLNFSNNNLSGRVPPLLSKKFNSSSFSGNTLLCGYSFATPCPRPTPSPSSKHKRTLNKKELFLISAGIAVAFLLLLLCCFLLCFVHCRNGAVFRKQSKSVEKAEQPGTESGGEFGGKLVHFDGPFIFTADDLLCATAEIMGKSTYGTVYRATLEDGNQVAVKRLREKMAKSQKEFESEASLLGKIRHSNLLALRAYYLGPKGEKLLVFDFVPNGSLSSLMHERAAEAPPDWEGRMRIALGVAKGLAFLHDELNLAHGNLTSSNVLIDENHDAKIGDFGVSKLMTANGVGSAASAAGYRAPEAVKMRRAGGGGKSADVYSFGVIALELLTGKSPGEAVDLPQWVASIVKEEWTNEVFDLDLMREATGNAGDELLNTLKLALHCVDPSPAARPEIKEVLRQLEEIKPELAAPAVPKEEGGSGKNACD